MPWCHLCIRISAALPSSCKIKDVSNSNELIYSQGIVHQHLMKSFIELSRQIMDNDTRKRYLNFTVDFLTPTIIYDIRKYDLVYKKIKLFSDIRKSVTSSANDWIHERWSIIDIQIHFSYQESIFWYHDIIFWYKEIGDILAPGTCTKKSPYYIV